MESPYSGDLYMVRMRSPYWGLIHGENQYVSVCLKSGLRGRQNRSQLSLIGDDM